MARQPSLEPPPLDQLLRLRVAAEAGLPLTGDIAAWLLEALDRYLEHGEPLERALGLAKAGQCKPMRQQARRERDRWLCEAAQHLGLDPASGNGWLVAQALARAVVRFEATVWPRLRTSAAPLEHATPQTDLRSLLTRAFQVGFVADEANPVPTSARQLYRIIQAGRAGPF